MVSIEKPDFRNIGLGLAAGFIGTIGFVASNAVLRDVEAASPGITALYGLPATVAFTLLIHFFHGSILGGLYAAILEYLPEMDRIQEIVIGGVAYGILTTVVFAAIVMPLWHNAVGFADEVNLLAAPFMSYVTHVIYGLVLATAYRLLRENY